MSLSRGRRRITINGATLSRAQTITFERQQAAGQCFTAADGITRCKNENKGTFFNRSSNITPDQAKPTKADTFKSISQIEPNCFTSSDGTKICKDDEGKNVDIETGVKQGQFFKGIVNLNPAATALVKRFGNNPVKTTLKIKDDTVELFLDNENKVRAAIVIADAIALGLMAVGGVIVATTAATGVGAAVGGAIAGTGAGLSFGATKAEQALDRLDKTRRALQQLEDAVEVAKQTTAPKINRDALIAENQGAIDNRIEELLEMTKTDLQSRATDLKLVGVGSLKKADLAKEVAEFEIIGSAGKEKVEPKIGKSRLRATLEAISEVVNKKLDSNEEIRVVMEQFDVDEDEAKRLLLAHRLQVELDTELEKQKKTKEDKQTRLEEIGKPILDAKARQEKVDEIARLLGLPNDEAEALFVKKELQDEAEALRLKLKSQKDSDINDEAALLALQKELAELLGEEGAERQLQREPFRLGDIIDPDAISDPSEPSDEFSDDLGVPDAQQIRLPTNIIGRPQLDESVPSLASDPSVASVRPPPLSIDPIAPLPPNLDPSPLIPAFQSPRQKLKKNREELAENRRLQQELFDILNEESVPFVAPSPRPDTTGLDISESIVERTPLAGDEFSDFSSEVSRPKPLPSPLEPPRDPTIKQFISPDFVDILDDADKSESVAPPKTKNEKIRDCARDLSSVSNFDLINGASRRKLDAAMKTDLLAKPTNYNNPQNLTAAQIVGATGTGPLAKSKAATIHKNDNENIYNKLVRQLTEADDCRAFLTANKPKIDILSATLKRELERYCECIMDDDE